MDMCDKIFNHLGTGLLAKKQRLGLKLAGVWARGASEKNGTPYLFQQPLKLATSNLVHNLVLGLAYQKTMFWTKIGGGLGQRSIRKMWDPYLFLQPLKLANFKFGTQIGFETSLPKNDV